MSTSDAIVQTATDTSDGVQAFEPEREVRFAVVMYGGVSLAIYINGITQELLNMVRATAPGTAQGKPWLERDQLKGTEKVYRKLAYYLDQCRGASESEEEADKQPRTRFVVDIISGTSAGGINGVFSREGTRTETENGWTKGALVERGRPEQTSERHQSGGLRL